MNEMKEIFEESLEKERRCLKQILKYFNEMPGGFDEAFDNMYFDNENFKNILIDCAEEMKYRNKIIQTCFKD